MRAPLNRRVYVVGYGAVTPLGLSFGETWERAVRGEAGFRRLSRCAADTQCNVVGEIPDWDPDALDFSNARENHYWNAGFVLLTMKACRDALADAGLEMDEETAPRTACLVGSSLNGHDAFRVAMLRLAEGRPLQISPHLLPNLCGNVPAGKAGMLLGFTGPIFSPQGACASGNYALGVGARMIRDGDCDFVLAGGVDTPLVPEIVHGFDNMNATIKIRPGDRAEADPGQASRPFSRDRRGFVLSEGAGVLVLAAEDALARYRLEPRAEILGVGWSSDAFHATRPNRPTIVRAIRECLADAGVDPREVGLINTHGTSTPRGDANEIACLREVFGEHLPGIPIVSNKSQIGHTLGAAAAIEGALSIESMRRGILLPTINLLPDPEFAGLDLVPDSGRRQAVNAALSNAFGFGGTNACILFGRAGKA